jgi:hypothetical protein
VLPPARNAKITVVADLLRRATSEHVTVEGDDASPEQRVRAKLAADFVEALLWPNQPGVDQLDLHTAAADVVDETDFYTLLKASRVADVKAHTEWVWGVLHDALQYPSAFAAKVVGSQPAAKAYKRLLAFFKPSSQLFGSTRTGSELARSLEEIGRRLIAGLLESQPGAELVRQSEIVPEMAALLAGVGDGSGGAGSLAPGSTTMSVGSIRNTMARAYVVFLGVISSLPLAEPLLERAGAIPGLYQLCKLGDRDDILRLLLPVLDIGRAGQTARSGHARTMLLTAATTSSAAGQLLVCSILEKVLAGSRQSTLNCWVLQVLGTMLQSDSKKVRAATLAVLAAGCADREVLKLLVDLDPPLAQVGAAGCRVLYRFLAVPAGFQMLRDRGFVKTELTAWRQHKAEGYVHVHLSAFPQPLSVSPTVVVSQPVGLVVCAPQPSWFPNRWASCVCFPTVVVSQPVGLRAVGLASVLGLHQYPFPSIASDRPTLR